MSRIPHIVYKTHLAIGLTDVMCGRGCVELVTDDETQVTCMACLESVRREKNNLLRGVEKWV